MNDLLLWDHSAALGRIVVESDDGVVLGDFFPFADYDKYAGLFMEYEAAANDQQFVEVDRLDKVIADCGFQVTELDGSRAQPVDDVQIGSSRISFRWRDFDNGG